MPLTNRAEAKEGGFAQVRAALEKFEGDVVSAEFGQWGGKLVDDEGKPIPPREFLEIVSTNNVPIEVLEDLSMDITDKYSFRVNCSEYKGSFWVDAFLASADKAKLLIPDDLVGKRIAWRRFTLEARDPKYNSTNYLIEKVVIKKATPKVVVKATYVTTTAPEEVAEEEVSADDPMAVVIELAVGKTETQFRSAISLHPAFMNSPLLPLAKAGAITKSLIEQGKLVLVQEGTKQVYRKSG